MALRLEPKGRRKRTRGCTKRIVTQGRFVGYGVWEAERERGGEREGGRERERGRERRGRDKAALQPTPIHSFALSLLALLPSLACADNAAGEIEHGLGIPACSGLRPIA